MNAVTESILIVGGGVILAMCGALIARRSFLREEFTKHHEVAGYLLSIVGTLYSVLLGLIVVDVQSKFDQARMMAESEASSCSAIVQFSRGFPPDVRNSIRIPLKNYYTTVQAEDWEAIASGATVEGSIPAYQALWRSIASYDPNGNREISCYNHELDTMKSLSDARRYRMFARKRALSNIVWAVLIVGAVLTITFTYMFWVESKTLQLVLTVFVALFILLNLLLVRLFENPYRQELGIKEGSFSFNPNVVFNGPQENPSENSDPVLK
jgi:Protein of unknown function (DUF4239)